MELEGLSVIAVKSMLADMEEVPDELLEAMSADPRNGIRSLAESIRRKRTRDGARDAVQESMLELERSYHSRGFKLVAGVDEAGRGPLAGPVVAAAVVFPSDCDCPHARDSKKLPVARREELYDQIMERALTVGVGLADHEEIDRINIYNASLAAMYRAVENLKMVPDVVIVDGPMVLRLDIPQQAVPGGDAKCLTVAAGSIIAKVTRDRMMKEYDTQYPGYGFARHKGYGTADHMTALRELGPCPIHRRSFEVVAQLEPVVTNMSEQGAFFLEGIEKSTNLEELETLAEGIRQIRDSLSPEELTVLRSAYRKARQALTVGPSSD
ncbi:ribonuclease HII [Gemmatimonadota bacterium]